MLSGVELVLEAFQAGGPTSPKARGVSLPK